MELGAERERERLALLKFKSQFTDGGGMVSDWGTSQGEDDDHEKECCKWDGVVCDNRTNHVIRLDLRRAHVLGPAIFGKGNINMPALELPHLNYLDLNHNKFNGIQIPEFICSLGKLQHLDLGYSGFSGQIPHCLGNSSLLQFLDLSRNWLYDWLYDTNLDWLYDTNLDWLSGLKSLKHLDLSGTNFQGATIPCSLGNLTSLQFLALSKNNLSGPVPKSIGYLSKIETIMLDSNKFNGIQIPEFICSLGKLQHLDLGDSGFSGQIPHCLGNLSMLQFLDLTSINWLYDTNLDWLSGLKSLKHLDLSGTNFQGATIPCSLGNLTSLQFLALSENGLSGPVPKCIKYLSKIETIMLDSNHLEGLISEAHLFNLSKLRTLDLSFNSNLTVRINSFWNPPFQLESLNLGSCKLGPYFPNWLQKQKQLQDLDISNANIFDNVPNWFWDNIQMCWLLNMSYNHIYGVIPDLSSLINLTIIELNSNEFNGSLPLLPPNISIINFSGNSLSGTICNIFYTCRFVLFLDLSDNLFSTQIPQRCFMNLMKIENLNLANNDFSGEIPNSINLPCRVFSLHLRNNSFTGEISRSLKRCDLLNVLDLGENNFTGEIPEWLGPSMPELTVLSLKSNNFHGSLPRSLCHLQHLQVLDISFNNISGTIPECLKNFTQLRSPIVPNSVHFSFYNIYADQQHENAYVVWKGKETKYTSNLRFLTLIDLSSNNLMGEIPREVTSLAGLLALNLSRNNLVGSIPSDIDRLEILDALDLSKNKLSGSIPPALAQLNLLGVLDLSFNNLSGKIPWDANLQTFNASIYVENPGLCGPPLVLKPCPNDNTLAGNVDETNNPEDDNLFDSRDFYVSMALGFIVAFWGVSGTLFLNRWCRITIAKLFVCVGDWLYVKIMINKNYLQRYFGNC